MIETIKRLLGITPKIDLGELIRNGATIVDVRTKGEYSEGHIRGSINISVDRLAQNIGKLKGKNNPIITCCASGMRSASAKGILRSNGFTNVHNGGSWMSLKRKYNL
ncbi:MAG: Rhodanese domain protein [Bacteroidetes bacterium]|nr:Rhodanese domain protein [Bacteroidota bacterium]